MLHQHWLGLQPRQAQSQWQVHRDPQRWQSRQHYAHPRCLTTVAAGGHELCELVLSADLFAAAAMQQVSKDLLAMTVAELKAELEARGEGKSGNKSWLRRRLHAAIMCDYL